MDDCPVCGEPLDPSEADGKFDPAQVVYSDVEGVPSYHLGCEDGVIETVYAKVD